MSRSRFYNLTREHPELIRKDGRTSLVDFDAFDRVLDALPIFSGEPSKAVA